MNMSLREARLCLEGQDCENCKFNKQHEFDCRDTALSIAVGAINYLMIGMALGEEMEEKER